MLDRLYGRLLTTPAWVVTLALLSVVPAGYWSAKLFQDLRADVRELLPRGAPSVRTLEEMERRFGGFSQLSIVVESPDPSANRRFSDDLVAALSNHSMVRSIRNKLGTERKFFKERRLLFIDLEDLEEILERIENAAHEMRARANPLLVDLEEEIDAPIELDFSDIEKKYEGRFGFVARFPDDYFESQDRKELAIILRKHGLAFGISSNVELVAHVKKTITTLDPARYHPEMAVELGGDVENVIEEHASLVEDLVVASVVVASLLALVVVFYYRRARALYLVSLPVLVGCAWTFGLSHFLIGYLNASSAFLGPIIPGNGINFGLILLARYIEERRRGVAIEPSTLVAVKYTAKATSIAAAAASVAYGSLVATDFLGFKHFGIIGGIGMIFCWVSTFLVLPPLIVWVERAFPLDPTRELQLIRPGLLASLPVRLVGRVPRAFAWGGILSGAVGLALGIAFFRDPFEKDFHKLRSRVTLESGAGKVAAKVDAIFGLHQEPQVIVADREEDVGHIVAHLEKVIAEGGDLAPITDVTALATFVPPKQEEKMVVLRKIRAQLSDDLLSNLSDETREIAERRRPPENLAPFTLEDLPESVRADFRELDGREGRVVLALPNMKLNLYHADVIKKIAEVVRSIPLPEGRTIESSGNFVIYADMIDAIAVDGPKATAYSFIGVLALCALAYRRLRSVIAIAGTLLLGVAWLAGILELGAIRINFLNFIGLPITFGIGVDYAVNVYSRYLLERKTHAASRAAREAVISTGGAVVLCSLTTIIGYGSLLLARNGALISFGQIAIAGEIACLGAAILVLPAWLMHWRDDRSPG